MEGLIGALVSVIFLSAFVVGGVALANARDSAEDGDGEEDLPDAPVPVLDGQQIPLAGFDLASFADKPRAPHT